MNFNFRLMDYRKKLLLHFVLLKSYQWDSIVAVRKFKKWFEEL